MTGIRCGKLFMAKNATLVDVTGEFQLGLIFYV